ncbi:FAD/NAD(P)-binding domain-containing protein [Annulohypoxylon maeteangense]|uniref:FAD/NAD(P)-binding domain-containing protein n=1 Tax=Annulohypoxylon maeteangense TaxID=1927788 RepID=UPI00200840C4|nr:FAD/NAD(P)-binding domain-containing protein [Annulohypoxylon maeteangense]KAI0881809.1 FAD/NAD(P)-binding domain-containing protein [Annulohypoxylon maeteangense]
MKSTIAFGILPLLSLAGAAAIAPRQDPTYDAIIIGGGPSGLSALSGLARVRRNVLLIDSGEYRNGPTRHMHDVLGFDGVTPAYYRWAAREQISHYDTVSAVNGTVTAIESLNNNTQFSVATSWADGTTGTVSARKIVLATGLRDILPDTPGLKENWGKGIFWCPWCDGHEHADQALGLLGPLEEAASLVREISTLNSDIIAFVNGTDTEEQRAAATASFPEWQKYLEIKNVTIDNRTITRVNRLKNGSDPAADPSLPTVPEYDLFSLDFSEGESVQRAAFFTSFPDEQKSDVGEKMGVTLYGGRLTADGSKGLVTNIPGVYAIGDANSDNVTNVPHALFTGKRTAVYVHVQLAREEAQRELAANATVTRREKDLNLRAIWDEMNPRGLLYAGEFDQ